MLLIIGFLFMVFLFVGVGILTQMLIFFVDVPSFLLIIVKKWKSQFFEIKII